MVTKHLPFVLLLLCIFAACGNQLELQIKVERPQSNSLTVLICGDGEDAAQVDEWLWYCGDSTPVVVVKSDTFQHTYPRLGTYTIRMIGKSGSRTGGAETSYTLCGSNTEFKVVPSCDTATITEAWMDQSKDSMFIDWGDGSGWDDSRSAQHLYNSPGNYHITARWRPRYCSFTLWEHCAVDFPIRSTANFQISNVGRYLDFENKS